MTTLHIEHQITDLATWLNAFGRFAEVRQAAGVTSEAVRQPVDDDRYIVIDLEFGNDEQALAFLAFLRTNVWQIPENSPGLAGTPEARLLRTVEIETSDAAGPPRAT